MVAARRLPEPLSDLILPKPYSGCRTVMSRAKTSGETREPVGVATAGQFGGRGDRRGGRLASFWPSAGSFGRF